MRSCRRWRRTPAFAVAASGVVAACGLAAQPAAAWYVGSGFSSVTDGREIPALSVGVDLTKSWTLSGMMAGARTPAYYESGFTANLMSVTDMGQFWGGELKAAFGGGAYYGQKGIYTQVDASGHLSSLQHHDNYTVGPAFRVAYEPFAHTFIGIEYLLGLNFGVLGMGWPNIGLGSVGVEF